ncbi:hypothetical protein BTO00_22630, partial [Vibrio campbellii]|uniref:FG-GAP repeat protein n=1 Tax=Vibrio campbellii TaxID=680 RepID=UPI000D4C4C91
NTPPTYDTYTTAGFDTLMPYHVDVLNEALVLEGISTLAGLDTVIAALETLNTHALGSSSSSPEIADYEDAGLTGVDVNNLEHLNTTLNREQRFVFGEYFKSSSTSSYGYSSALSDDGNTLAVLAYRSRGTVMVYRRAGDVWEEAAELEPSTSSINATAIAMSANGQRILIGANTNAYIYDVDVVNETPDWQSWSLSRTVEHSLSSIGSLDLSADGAVFAVGYSSTTAKLYRETATGNWVNRFSSTNVGGQVSLSGNGDVFVIGDTRANTNQGLVRIYRRNNDTWSSTGNVVASNPTDSDYFGYSVSVNRAGNRIAVGARYEDGPSTGGQSAQGAVYVFDYDGSSWSETQLLRASDAEKDDRFGSRVALSPQGDQLVVSINTPSGPRPKAIYHYDISVADSTLSQSTEQIVVSPNSTEDHDAFASQFAFNGEIISVGAYSDDNNFVGQVRNSFIDEWFDSQDDAFAWDG